MQKGSNATFCFLQILHSLYYLKLYIFMIHFKSLFFKIKLEDIHFVGNSLPLRLVRERIMRSYYNVT